MPILVGALMALEQGDEIKGVVLDLRNNTGGLLDQAVKVTNMLIDKGLIVYTAGRVKDQFMEFRATTTGKHYNFKLGTLINEGSASASEIVAGALQDHYRSLILGSKSFGKASVQTIITLPDSGSGLRLTTAYYYTPKGRHIQKGIRPDVEVGGPCVPCEKGSIDNVSLKADPVVVKALDWLKSDVTVTAYKQSGKKKTSQ